MESTPRTDDRGICYGSGVIVAETFLDARGVNVGTCPECGRDVGLKAANAVRPPRCLNWHRPTVPVKPDLKSRAGRVRRRKVLVDQ